MEEKMKKKSKIERWTPEEKAELRKQMPEKLNKLGEWFFSDDKDKEFLIIVDEDAVLRRH
ncbi:MAG: hypothetical protein LUC86_09080 [Prevotellaceae bacterium]|nr:hypothetical protein [Prevotellaceae bacterium]MCD8304957.1 hypothetical protein [Prevotellaceae bacterium]